MKNLALLIIFTVLSVFLLLIMMLLVLLPKICSCFNNFCNKNHAKLALQKEHAQKIRQARLRLAYKSQIMNEQPGNEELEISRGIFFDKESQQKFFDEASLIQYKKELYQDETLQSRLHVFLGWLNDILFNSLQLVRGLLHAFYNQLSKPVSRFLNH